MLYTLWIVLFLTFTFFLSQLNRLKVSSTLAVLPLPELVGFLLVAEARSSAPDALAEKHVHGEKDCVLVMVI